MTSHSNCGCSYSSKRVAHKNSPASAVVISSAYRRKPVLAMCLCCCLCISCADNSAERQTNTSEQAPAQIESQVANSSTAESQVPSAATAKIAEETVRENAVLYGKTKNVNPADPAAAEPNTTTTTARPAANPAVPAAAPPAADEMVAATSDKLRNGYFVAAREARARRTHTEAFRELMAELLDSFPETQVTTGDQALQWNVAILNTYGVGFSAIRFRSPIDGPADLYCVVGPESAFQTWSLYPMRGAIVGLSELYSDNSLVSQDSKQSSFLRLPGGKIRPDVDYIIWFMMRDRRPVELRYAIRLARQGENLE